MGNSTKMIRKIKSCSCNFWRDGASFEDREWCCENMSKWQSIDGTEPKQFFASKERTNLKISKIKKAGKTLRNIENSHLIHSGEWTEGYCLSFSSTNRVTILSDSLWWCWKHSNVTERTDLKSETNKAACCTKEWNFGCLQVVTVPLKWSSLQALLDSGSGPMLLSLGYIEGIGLKTEKTTKVITKGNGKVLQTW